MDERNRGAALFRENNPASLEKRLRPGKPVAPWSASVRTMAPPSKRYAAESCAVAMLSRTTNLTSRLIAELPGARAYVCDVSDPSSVDAAFAAIEADLGPVDILVYNADIRVWGDFEEVEESDFEAAWRVNAFGAFARAAQRSLAESLARALGTNGIHVSLIIIDGVVDEPAARAQFADRPDRFFVKPSDVAKMALMLTKQRPSAWSFELEAPPFGEKW